MSSQACGAQAALQRSPRSRGVLALQPAAKVSRSTLRLQSQVKMSVSVPFHPVKLPQLPSFLSLIAHPPPTLSPLEDKRRDVRLIEQLSKSIDDTVNKTLFRLRCLDTLT